MWVKHEAASDAVFHYMSNHQGSVIGYVDATSGAQQAIYTYDAYGNSPGAEASGQPYRYTGRRYDAETGLYYYRARYYSPKLGRFLQTDPIGYEDNMNLYGYTANDPVNATDPSGNSALTKAIKFVFKGGDVAATFAGVVDDYNTLTDGDASTFDRAFAAVSLVSELAPISVGDIKDGIKLAEKGIDAVKGLKKGPCCFVAGTPVLTSTHIL